MDCQVPIGDLGLELPQDHLGQVAQQHFFVLPAEW